MSKRKVTIQEVNIISGQKNVLPVIKMFMIRM